MATFTKILGLQSGVQAVAKSGDTIDFDGFTLTNVSTTAIDDSTGDLTLDGSGGLSSTGITTMALDSSDTTNLSMSANDAGAKTLTVFAGNGGGGAANLVLQADSEVDITGNDLDLNATGLISVDAGGSISLDAAQASNFTVAGNDLTLSTTTRGEIDITSAGLIDINAAANLDIDVTGTYDMLASGAFSIDGTGASNLTATSGNLTVSTATSGNLSLTSADAILLSAGDASDFSLPDNTASAFAFTEGGSPYLSIDTTDNQELVIHHKHLVHASADGSSAVIQNGFLAGETITTGHVVALDYDTDGARVFTCQSDDAEAVRQNAYGVVLAGNTAGNGVPVAVGGIVSVVCTDAISDTGADIGAFVYVDDGAKAGQVTKTPPSAGRVYKVGIIVAGNGNTADTAVTIALQPQFMYDN